MFLMNERIHFWMKMGSHPRWQLKQDAKIHSFHVSVTYRQTAQRADLTSGRTHVKIGSCKYYLIRPSWHSVRHILSHMIGHCMREVMSQGVHSLILTSGTLAPLTSFASEMQLPFPVSLENPHIIQGNQFWVRKKINLLTTWQTLDVTSSWLWNTMLNAADKKETYMKFLDRSVRYPKDRMARRFVHLMQIGWSST